MDVEYDFNGIKGDVCYIHSSYLDNLENLSDSFIAQAERVKKLNPAKYRHLFLGEWVDETEGALWKQSTMIDPFIVHKHPEMKRIVVGVDPSVSSTGDQDECGVVVAGLGIDGDYYVLADESGVYSPLEWGRVTAGQYKKYQADRVIAEINQGGDLVEMNIKNVDNSVMVKKVRATRGKLVRAEPVAADARRTAERSAFSFPTVRPGRHCRPDSVPIRACVPASGDRRRPRSGGRARR